MIEQSPAWDKFGFKLDEENNLTIEDTGFDEKLKVIIVDVLQNAKHNEKPFSRLKNEEITEYFDSIIPETYERVKDEIAASTNTNLFGAEATDMTAASRKRSNPKSTSRSYLIPKTCALVIDENKINNVFRELRDDLLLDDSKKTVPNAVGVLFRVFLEISVDFFLEKKGCTCPADTKLAGKITKIADYMEEKAIATAGQLKNVRSVATNKQSLLAIENFHSYVHSYKTQPTSSDLKGKWDNLQEFFEILWGSLQKKK